MICLLSVCLYGLDSLELKKDDDRYTNYWFIISSISFDIWCVNNQWEHFNLQCCHSYNRGQGSIIIFHDNLKGLSADAVLRFCKFGHSQ